MAANISAIYDLCEVQEMFRRYQTRKLEILSPRPRRNKENNRGEAGPQLNHFPNSENVSSKATTDVKLDLCSVH
jgi:hypothetical protein